VHGLGDEHPSAKPSHLLLARDLTQLAQQSVGNF
jgi:hypothetical protein